MSSDGYVSKLQGLSLRNVAITLYDGDKKIYSDFNLALKEFKGNKSYISVIKSKTNVLVSKTGIKVDDELEELANLIAY